MVFHRIVARGFGAGGLAVPSVVLVVLETAEESVCVCVCVNAYV